MNTKTKILTLLSIAAALRASAPAWSAYDDVGVSARVMGLGNAYTAVADDVYSVYYNPAGLANLPQPEVGATYTQFYPGLTDNSTLQDTFLAYAMPLKEGRQGGLGLAANYFSLNSLYHETSLYGSYGRDLLSAIAPDRLYGGVTLKYLNRGLSNVGDLANQPIGPTGQVQVGATDPVLQNASRSNFDADLGLLYKIDMRWTAGLQVQHALEPNIAFNGSDTLGRNYKLGVSYKTPFALLAGEIDNETAPDMSRENIATIAAEKWLPTLSFGTFGIRGSLGAGSRDFRQATFGVSYKINRMEFDYGTAIPLGGLASTYGTQRLGITFFFGHSKTPKPSFQEAIFENMGDLAEGGNASFEVEAKELGRYQREALETFLSKARVLSSEGRYADAAQEMGQAQALAPNDSHLAESVKRLKAVADVYPEVKDFATNVSRAALYEGIESFLAGKDKDALDDVATAQTLAPQETTIGALRTAMLRIAGAQAIATAAPVSTVPVAAAVPPPAPVAVVSTTAVAGVPVSTTPAAISVATAPAAEVIVSTTQAVIKGDMALIEVALDRSDYAKAAELGRTVVELDPWNAQARLRLGVADFGLKKYPEALSSLREALRLTNDPAMKEILKSYIKAVGAVGAKAPPKARPAASPEDVENLYNAGVELYTQGRLDDAAKMFKKLLALDPENAPAHRALNRVQIEMKEMGETRGGR